MRERTRYERDGVFVEFEPIDSESVDYSYGSVGFNSDDKRTVSMQWATSRSQALMNDGWRRVDEKPTSEIGNMGGDELLDWIGRITR